MSCHEQQQACECEHHHNLVYAVYSGEITDIDRCRQILREADAYLIANTSKFRHLSAAIHAAAKKIVRGDLPDLVAANDMEAKWNAAGLSSGIWIPPYARAQPFAAAASPASPPVQPETDTAATVRPAPPACSPTHEPD